MSLIEQRDPSVQGIVIVNGYVPMVRKPTGLWLPGGKYRNFSDPEINAWRQRRTLVEEFDQELNMGIKPLFEIAAGPHPHPNPQKAQNRTMSFWACAHVGGLPFNKEPHKHQAVEFIAPRDVVNVLAGRNIPFEVLMYIKQQQAQLSLPQLCA